MIKKPKLSQTLIYAIFVGLIPFATEAMDIRFTGFSITGLAIVLVPLIWLSLIVWHVRASKVAKSDFVINVDETGSKLKDHESVELVELRKPKLADTLLKGLIITIGMLILTWIGLRLEHTAFKFMALALFFVPISWCWLVVGYLNRGRHNGYGQGHSSFNTVTPMHDHGTNTTIGPMVTAFQHNQLSPPAYQTPMMTRTPDYSLGPDSGMYTTRWN